ncbi:hypothetical protein [Ruminococcus sp.]|uniref:hypothetical protein n=1 Tax=Ruminococcus sp. TaxID=41978 RepID=UPI0025F3B475|nr:hypothetical protein [Ruminococcus sp.]
MKTKIKKKDIRKKVCGGEITIGSGAGVNDAVISTEAGAFQNEVTVNNGCSLITGANSYKKRKLIHAMIDDSLSNGHKVILIKINRNSNNDEFMDVLEYANMPNLTCYDVFSECLPYDLLSVDPNASVEELKKALFEKVSATGIYSITKLDDIGTFCDSYIDDTIERIRENGYININAFEAILQLAERYNNNDGNEHVRISDLFDDITSCEFEDCSFCDFIKESKEFIIMKFDCGIYKTNAAIIADMVLCDILNYQRKHNDEYLDLYFDDLNLQNYHIASPIRRIINEAKSINLTFTGISEEYYPKGTNKENVLNKFDDIYFLNPTNNSKEAVYKAIGLTSGEDWPLDNSDDGITYLNRRNDDVPKGYSTCIYRHNSSNRYADEENK